VTLAVHGERLQEGHHRVRRCDSGVLAPGGDRPQDRRVHRGRLRNVDFAQMGERELPGQRVETAHEAHEEFVDKVDHISNVAGVCDEINESHGEDTEFSIKRSIVVILLLLGKI